MADLPPTEPVAQPDGTAPAAGAPEAPEMAIASSPITSAQADEILAELKAIKQNLFWVLLLAGFFAARAFFFHY